MSSPLIAHRKGFLTSLQRGRPVAWCSCGRSATQPFCDGAHLGSDFKPVMIRVKQDEEVILCGCKHTRTPPFCDGTHSNLPGGYRDDDPDSAENRAITMIEDDSAARIDLDGSCYVFRTGRAVLRQRDGMGYCAVIGPQAGARFQSQFYAEIAPGSTPVIDADGRDTVLFTFEGEGEVEIGTRLFSLAPRNGFYVRPGESYRIHNNGSDRMRLFISQGPCAEDLVFLPAMKPDFDADFPERRAEIDPEQRQKMAERHFQMLIHRPHGSTLVTQFIGNIPWSKAEPHRHLYEEALIFLNGSGVVWTENRRTRVAGGDVLFLPAKQLHSVQCTQAGGFDVVGVIYPGDNPAINY